MDAPGRQGLLARATQIFAVWNLAILLVLLIVAFSLLKPDTFLTPFTFQSMEKHSAYCAMIRLGLKVPPTTLVPYKNPVDNVRWAYTAEKYNRAFDIDRIADDHGYPLYMKPFDGGGWRGHTLAALPQIIDRLRARGYRLVTVAQLLRVPLIRRTK